MLTAQSFDPGAAVDEYQQIIADREAEPSALGKADCDAIARRMRARWREWQGEDSLHEMAFGESPCTLIKPKDSVGLRQIGRVRP